MQREAAPAKLNLSLHVVGRRPDGLHLLESLVAFTVFGDELTVTPADRDEVVAEGPFAAAITGPNLIERARDRLRQRLERADPVRISLTKRLPVASGMGGGSADAAAALRALARVWPGVDDGAVHEVAASLGADVPMCLSGRTAIARGMGHELSFARIEALKAFEVLLVNPGVPVSTPTVFAALRTRDNAPLPPLPSDPDADDLLGWLRETRNDLEPPARLVAPKIDVALAALRDAEFARMSGSGATCFGLYRSQQAAEAARERIAAAQPGWFVAQTRFATGGIA